jgi:hypothetical protein
MQNLQLLQLFTRKYELHPSFQILLLIFPHSCYYLFSSKIKTINNFDFVLHNQRCGGLLELYSWSLKHITRTLISAYTFLRPVQVCYDGTSQINSEIFSQNDI